MFAVDHEAAACTAFDPIKKIIIKNNNMGCVAAGLYFSPGPTIYIDPEPINGGDVLFIIIFPLPMHLFIYRLGRRPSAICPLLTYTGLVYPRRTRIPRMTTR